MWKKSSLNIITSCNKNWKQFFFMKLAVIHSSLLQLPTVSKFSDNGVFYVFYPYCLPNLAPNIHPSPGQPQDVISPTYPASAPGAPHTKTCLEHLMPLREKISRDTSTLPGISFTLEASLGREVEGTCLVAGPMETKEMTWAHLLKEVLYGV